MKDFDDENEFENNKNTKNINFVINNISFNQLTKMHYHNILSFVCEYCSILILFFIYIIKIHHFIICY